MDLFNNIRNLLLDPEESHRNPITPGRARAQLLLISFTILFLELIFIRWLPAYVRFLSYVTNVIMMASFLGIGLGILVSRWEGQRLPNFSAWLLLVVAVTVIARVDLYLPSTQVLYFAAGEYAATPESAAILPVLFFLVTVTFMVPARRLGGLLRALPPLEAYALDIAGSLAGVAVFFILSYFSQPPFVWFLLLCVLVMISEPHKHWPRAVPFLIGTLIVVYSAGRESLWSPYYRIQVRQGENQAYLINVNNIGHQIVTHSANRENFYFRVYDLFDDRTFENVLVLGAGSGTDVSIALDQGALHVDAVEIDPVIYQLGHMLNPDRPYEDRRVRVHITDGRSFLASSSEKYDLIIFGLTDSLTLTSSYSNLRLESFLLTVEAFESAQEHLADDGLVVLYNYYREDWLVRKLAGMMNQVFGRAPYITTYGEYGHAAVLIDGPGLAGLDPAFNIAYITEIAEPFPSQGTPLPATGHGRTVGDSGQVPATDDWPFIYMQQPTVPALYLSSLGILLVITLAMTGLALPRTRAKSFDWHFFLLGAAFMLLETRSIVNFALLFGSTWLVNSLVFFGILLSVLLAILTNAHVQWKRPGWLYVALILSLFMNFLLPLKAFLSITSPTARYGLAALLTFAPIYCANLVFSHSFRDHDQADVAFASNMLGAMIGGMLEYLSLTLGYQRLLLGVIVLYSLAYVLLIKRPGQRTVSALKTISS